MQNPNQLISKAMIYDELAMGLRLRKMDEGEIKKRIERVLRICGFASLKDWPILALSYLSEEEIIVKPLLLFQTNFTYR